MTSDYKREAIDGFLTEQFCKSRDDQFPVKNAALKKKVN
jgi:hypothetical protein